MRKNNKKKFQENFSLAFTLIELLVVIAIIIILVTIGMVSFASAQKKGRDARRKADIKDIQHALEQYYAVCGSQYPTVTGFYSQIFCTTPSIGIMPTVPSDPKGTTPYYCSGTCGSSSYTICTGLEAETPATFCVSNQQ